MYAYGQIDVNGSAEITTNDEADLIRVSTGAGDGEVILASASSVLGRRYTIRRVAGTGSIYIYPTDSNDTIAGQSDYTMGSSSASTPVTFQAVQTGAQAYGYEIV